MKHFLHKGIIFIIILLSYFLYSFRFNAALNSDGAIQILMTSYLDFPGDLYYWGQNRWGSLIPFVAQVFYKGFHFSAVTSVSMVYYAILIMGYRGYSTLLKSNFSKIIFAIIVFLPPLRFIDVLWYPIGIQYALFGISLWIFNYIDFQNQKPKNFFLLFLISMLFISAQWVSDTAFVTIILCIVLHAVLYRKYSKINFAIVISLVCTLIFGALFIYYCKKNAFSANTNYMEMNSVENMVKSIFKMGKACYDLLRFNSNESLMSLYVYAACILLILSAVLVFRQGLSTLKESRWIYLFLADGLLAIFIAILSKWVFMNDLNRRYFLGGYVSLSLVILLILEHLNISNANRIALRMLLSATVAVGALSTPYFYKYVWLKSLTPQTKIYSEMSKLAPAGIIAEYWHSYITSCNDPENIIATPEENSLVRKPEMVDRVFSQPNIYLIRNDWLNYFPDTIHQFGQVLLRAGTEFKLSGCDMCRYQLKTSSKN